MGRIMPADPDCFLPADTYLGGNAMRRTFRLVLSALCPFLISTASEATTTRWDAASGLYPTQIGCPWTETNNTGVEPLIQGGALVISTSAPVTNNTYYGQSSISIPTALVVEFRVKYVSSTSTESSRSAVALAIETEPYRGTLFFVGQDEIFFDSGNLTRGGTATVDTDDSQHTYRIEVDAGTNALRIYQDGILQLSGSTFFDNVSPAWAGFPRIEWGEGSSAAYGTSEWEFFQHNAGPAQCCMQSLCDGFSNGALAPEWVEGSSGGNTAVESGGELVITKPEGEPPSLGAILSTDVVCGDFDVAVDYRFINFPAVVSAGARFQSLVVVDPTSGALVAGVERYRQQSADGCVPHTDSYKSYTATPGCSGDAIYVPTSDMQGSFRLVRQGTTIHAYYWSGTSWIETMTRAIAASPVRLKLYAGTNGSLTTGQQVAFDNLSLNTSDCSPTPVRTTTWGRLKARYR